MCFQLCSPCHFSSGALWPLCIALRKLSPLLLLPPLRLVPYSFIQETLTEHLLQVGHCPRRLKMNESWSLSSDKTAHVTIQLLDYCSGHRTEPRGEGREGSLFTAIRGRSVELFERGFLVQRTPLLRRPGGGGVSRVGCEGIVYEDLGKA